MVAHTSTALAAFSELPGCYPSMSNRTWLIMELE